MYLFVKAEKVEEGISESLIFHPFWNRRLCPFPQRRRQGIGWTQGVLSCVIILGPGQAGLPIYKMRGSQQTPSKSFPAWRPWFYPSGICSRFIFLNFLCDSHYQLLWIERLIWSGNPDCISVHLQLMGMNVVLEERSIGCIFLHFTVSPGSQISISGADHSKLLSDGIKHAHWSWLGNR